jgi:hypothetical protein
MAKQAISLSRANDGWAVANPISPGPATEQASYAQRAVESVGTHFLRWLCRVAGGVAEAQTERGRAGLITDWPTRPGLSV